MELDLEAQLSQAWRKRDFEKCTLLLKKVKYPLSPSLLALLEEILHRPHSLHFWQAYAFWERQTALRLIVLEGLKPYPVEVVAPLLIPLLSVGDAELMKEAKAMLREYGSLAIPYLMRSLTPEGHTKRAKRRWNIHGSDRVLELLGETRSTKVIPILEQAIQNRVYSYNHSSVEARLSTLLTWTLLLSGIGFYFDILGGILIFCFIAPCILGVQSIDYVDAKNHTQHSAWKALLLIPDRRVLFSILPFAERSDYLESLNQRYSLALAETLRQVDEAFAAELSPKHREGLHALLETQDQTLLEGVVYALGYVGNRTTLYFFKDLYAKTKNEEFKQQLRIAHERITVRLTRQKESKELLRASSLQDDPQILLRPSQESHDPQEQLLRPSEREK